MKPLANSLSKLMNDFRESLHRIFLIIVYFRWGIGIYIHNFYLDSNNPISNFVERSNGEIILWFKLAFPVWIISELVRMKEFDNPFYRFMNFIEKNKYGIIRDSSQLFVLAYVFILLAMWTFAFCASLGFLEFDLGLIYRTTGIPSIVTLLLLPISYLCIIRIVRVIISSNMKKKYDYNLERMRKL